MRILVVDSEPSRLTQAQAYLTAGGHIVTACREDEVPALWSADAFDLVLSACLMPCAVGFDLLHLVGTAVPVLFWNEPNCRMGIEPFSDAPPEPASLYARLDRAVCRTKCETGRRVTVGSLILDSDEERVLWGNAAVPLTAREFALLFFLICQPGKIYDRATLMRKIWPKDTASGERTVDVHVARLRAKLADCDDVELVGIPGKGYCAITSCG